MKLIVVLSICVALAAAAPAVEEPVKILRAEFNPKPEGSYDFTFETENGINRHEDGEVKEALDEENKTHKVVVVRGYYSYLNQDGKTETMNYYADETGFHPEGDSIPKPVTRR